MALTSMAMGASLLPASAGVIVDESFNYTLGASLDGLTGGSGWSGGWMASGTAVMGTGLTYGNIGVGSSGSGAVGDLSNEASLSRQITPQTLPNTLWIRTLYSPNAVDPQSASVIPVSFAGANGGSLYLERVAAVDGGGEGEGGGGAFTMNLLGLDSTPATSAGFNLSQATHCLLWRMAVNPNVGAPETLDMWVDPNFSSLGTPFASLTGNVLENDASLGTDYVALFSATGIGPDTIDELRIGDDLASMAAVPEPGAYAMGTIVLLGVGMGAGYRRYRAAKA